MTIPPPASAAARVRQWLRRPNAGRGLLVLVALSGWGAFALAMERRAAGSRGAATGHSAHAEADAVADAATWRYVGQLNGDSSFIYTGHPLIRTAHDTTLVRQWFSSRASSARLDRFEWLRTGSLAGLQSKAARGSPEAVCRDDDACYATMKWRSETACTLGMVRFVSQVRSDVRDGLLFSVDDEAAEWTSVVPGTLGDDIAALVCKQAGVRR